MGTRGIGFEMNISKEGCALHAQNYSFSGYWGICGYIIFTVIVYLNQLMGARHTHTYLITIDRQKHWAYSQENYGTLPINHKQLFLGFSVVFRNGLVMTQSLAN